MFSEEAQDRGSSWLLGRQLEKVPGSSKEVLLLRVVRGRKRRAGEVVVLQRILKQKAGTSRTILSLLLLFFKGRYRGRTRKLQTDAEGQKGQQLAGFGIWRQMSSTGKCANSGRLRQKTSLEPFASPSCVT